jgi:hypothetical protein
MHATKSISSTAVVHESSACGAIVHAASHGTRATQYHAVHHVSILVTATTTILYKAMLTHVPLLMTLHLQSNSTLLT